MITPPCRVCGKSEWVGCYHEDRPELAICPTCCETAEHPDGETGHQFYREPGEGMMCRYCGINRNDTLWDPSDDYS